MTTETVERDLVAHLEKRTGSPWTPTRDLFADGGLSSLFAMELVVHLEQTYAIAIGGRDLRLDNFRTVTAMVDLVRRLREDAA